MAAETTENCWNKELRKSKSETLVYVTLESLIANMAIFRSNVTWLTFEITEITEITETIDCEKWDCISVETNN